MRRAGATGVRLVLGLAAGCCGGDVPAAVPAAALDGLAPVWVELAPGPGPAAVAVDCDGTPHRVRLDPGPPPTWADPAGAPRPITAALRAGATLTLRVGGPGPREETLVLTLGEGLTALGLGERRLADARQVGALPRRRPAGCP